jgi:hypothetical protein
VCTLAPCTSTAQLAEHALRERAVAGSIRTGGFEYPFLKKMFDRAAHNWPRPGP